MISIHKSRRFILLFVMLTLMSQACAISLFKWPSLPTPSIGTPAPSGPTYTPAPRAEVTFTVRLPEQLLPGEVLAISVVDEVTGLALNAVDYGLTQVDAVTFTTKLTIPDQSVIRYRYVRLQG